MRYRVHGLTLVQSTRLTAQVLAYLKKLGVKPLRVFFPSKVRLHPPAIPRYTRRTTRV